jgi:hypothetical protein
MKTKTNLGGVSRTIRERARAVAFQHGQFLLTLVVLRDNQNLVLTIFSIPTATQGHPREFENLQIGYV